MIPKKDVGKASSDAFSALDKDVIANAKLFDYKYGSGDAEHIEWQILGDDEYITEDVLDIPDEVEYEKDIEWTPDMEFNEVFFEHFFPSIEGHGKLINEWLADI